MLRRDMIAGLMATGLAAAPGPGRAFRARESWRARTLYVDLGRAMLYAVEGAHVAILSRVIVGTRATPTPRVDSLLSHVRFRPTWRPTPRMVATGRYEDYTRPPGPSNPLGLAAIHFLHGGLIYLHGTNEPQLFARENRSLSNGCVRVETLEPLLAWILDWPRDAVQRALHGRRTYDEPTPPIPLVIAAATDEPLLGLLARVTEGQPIGGQV